MGIWEDDAVSAPTEHMAVRPGGRFVRSSEVKFKKMASGSLRSRASLDDEAADKLLRDLEKKGRAFANISVEVFDEEGDVTKLAGFDWYVRKRDEATG